MILRDLETEDFEEVEAYDGEINQMTFAHVKNSKAFDTKDLFDIEEESTIDHSYSRENLSNKDLFDSRYKKSEDGWTMKGNRLRNQFQTQ